MIPQKLNLIDFIYASNNTQTPDELKKAFLNFMSAFGIDRFIMGRMSHDSTDQKLQNMDIIANYPEEWLKHYKQERYVDNDIVYQTALSTSRPFTWQEISEKRKIPEASRKILKAAQEFKLYNGIGLSIHQPLGGIIGMGLSSSEKQTRYDQNMLNIVYAAANQFFIAYSDLIKTTPANANDTIELTLREREILLWLARGKTKLDIAAILNITESSVKKHCENIYKKLDVNNLQLAIVKSLRMGLIHPF